MTWTRDRVIAATMIAEGRLSDERIAEILRIRITKLAQWRADPTFSKRVEELVADRGTMAPEQERMVVKAEKRRRRRDQKPM